MRKIFIPVLLCCFSFVVFAQDALREARRSSHGITKAQNHLDDRELTRLIRYKISADKMLSSQAKNITIISENGNVTLRGDVANYQEKAKVEEIAKKSKGTRQVENLTEVATY